MKASLAAAIVLIGVSPLFGQSAAPAQRWHCTYVRNAKQWDCVEGPAVMDEAKKPSKGFTRGVLVPVYKHTLVPAGHVAKKVLY